MYIIQFQYCAIVNCLNFKIFFSFMMNSHRGKMRRLSSNATFSATRLNNTSFFDNSSNPISSSKFQLDFAYNRYLQSLMAKKISHKNLDQQTKSLDGQIHYQRNILEQKNKEHATIQSKIEILSIQKQIILLLNTLKGNLEILNSSYNIHLVPKYIEQIVQFLKNKCDTVILKNIKHLNSDEEFQKCVDILRELLANTEKCISNSNCDFKRIHDIAEKIKMYNKEINRIQREQTDLYEQQKSKLFDILKNMSDMMAS